MGSILITGGAGYIGTHTALELLLSKYDVIVYDNFSNSSRSSLKRVAHISGRSFPIIEGDICDTNALEKLFSDYEISSVIHFAGLKAVNESVFFPLKYYKNNVEGSLNLLSVMSRHNVKKIVFSSSATVYGVPTKVPLTEDMPAGLPINPYGMSKLMVESILSDLYESDNGWDIIVLRYFNPVGAHSSGMLGEDPKGIPNNLMPFISQAASGTLPKLSVYGDDYPTPDGTGIRDYIHVVDLAKGHLAAISKCNEDVGLLKINLGTGKGISVFEMIRTFEQVNKVTVPYGVAGRRKGDVSVCYADTSLALEVLGWKTTLDVEDMCRDSWRWQCLNPNGYESDEM